MNRADLKHMQTAGEQLSAQIKILQILYDETLQAEEKIKHMAYTDNTKSALVRSRKSLDENIRVLTSMADVLREACLEYRKTEERIVDRYNLDTVFYPEPRFETSRITGMEKYKSLMPF